MFFFSLLSGGSYHSLTGRSLKGMFRASYITHIIDYIIFSSRKYILGYKGNDLVEEKPKKEKLRMKAIGEIIMKRFVILF